ncbi:MAG: hypothetical protein RL758_1967 [Pseudomonadota bacterium]
MSSVSGELPVNQLVLRASLVGLSAARYTPAGIPVADVLLEHESSQVEADQPRRVQLQLRAVAFGVLAERLRTQPMGVALQLDGFLANHRNGKKGVVFHIQDFKPY